MTRTVTDYIADGFAIVGSMLGSGLIASNTGHNALGYFAFLIGGTATFYLLQREGGAWSIKFITAYFFLVNIVGLVRY